MNSFKSRQTGFSLVELMIALVLGVVVVGGSVSIFTGVIRSSNLNQTISNLQSNGRFAMDVIGRDIRSAGYIGCAALQRAVINASLDVPPTTNLIDSAISGDVVGASSWKPAKPLSYTAATGAGAPVVGTHALRVQYAEPPGLQLNTSMTPDSNRITVNKDNAIKLRANQLGLISDCSSADLFKVQSFTNTETTKEITLSEKLVKRYTTSAEFPESTLVMPFVSVIYYIGDTQRTTASGKKVLALYSHNFPYTAANPPLELVEGVDQLVLEFGVRQSDGTLRYALAGANGYSAGKIETVRMGLLLSSMETFSEVDASRVYSLAGQRVTPVTTSKTTATSSNTLTYTADKRMRMPFNTTLNVRNRNL